MTNPEFVYKVATAEVVSAAKAAAAFPRMPIDNSDGFVHFSTASQLRETLSLHFRGQENLILLAVRTADLGQTLVWEPSRGGQLFPHAYGDVPAAAVAWTAVISVAPDGSCPLPDDLR